MAVVQESLSAFGGLFCRADRSPAQLGVVGAMRFLTSENSARWFAGAAASLLVLGFILGLAEGGAGAVQLAMLNFPAAWLSTLLLLVLAFWAVLGLVLRSTFAFMMVEALAPSGGMFSFLTLWSGALWARAVTDAWWIASPQQVAEIVSLVVFCAVVALPSVLGAADAARRVGARIALLGVGVAPAAFFAMEWWHGLAGTSRQIRFSVDPAMLPSIAIVACGFWCYVLWVSMVRLRCIADERKRELAQDDA